MLTNFGHPNPPEVGILTGSAASPNVSVTGGTVSADTKLRIQVLQDVAEERLLFSLLDGGRIAGHLLHRRQKPVDDPHLVPVSRFEDG